MAKKALDILLTQDFDLKIEKGDFAFGDTTLQNQNLLILAAKGEFKGYPTVGVGAINYILDDTEVAALRVAIQVEFEKDGLHVNHLEVKEDYSIKKEAIYK